MSRNIAAVENIHCRVDVDGAVWMLVKFETQQEPSWQKFNNVTEMNRFVKATNVQCPQRCLTPDAANIMVGDFNRKIAGLERELQTCKALLAKQNLPNVPVASPLVTTTANLNHRVTTGTVQNSAGSSTNTTNNTTNTNSRNSSVVGPIGAKLGNTYPAALQNSFTTGMKRSASVLSVGSSGNNSEAESLSGARKLSKNASRIARSTSVNNIGGIGGTSNMSGSVLLPRTTPTSTSANSSGKKSTNTGLDLHSALRALPRKTAVLDTLDPYFSDTSVGTNVTSVGTSVGNSVGTGGTGTARSSQETPHSGGAPLSSRGGVRGSAGSAGSAGSGCRGGESEDERSYSSDGSAYNRHRDLECSVDTDDVGYGSESSVSVTSGPSSVNKPVAASTSGASIASGREMMGIALTAEPTLLANNTTTNTTNINNTNTITTNTTSPTNKRALHRSQSVESVNSNHSASSANSNSSVNSTHSRTGRRRVPVPSPAHTNTNNTNTNNTNKNTNNTNSTTVSHQLASNTHNLSIEDDSRMSLRLSQDDEESRSMLFAGLQDNSRTFTYTKNSTSTGGSGSSGNSSSTSGSGSGSGSGTGGGGLFGMVMSFASNYGNYVSKYLTPSQEEREKQARQHALHSTLHNNATTTSNNTANNTTTTAYSQGEDSCIMEYTRDATTFPHYTTNTTNPNTNNTNTNNTNNTATSYNELPILHTETPCDSLPVFDPNDEDTQSTQNTTNTLQTLLTHDSTAEVEVVDEVVDEVVLVPVDWARITTETQQALTVFQKAIQKSSLSPILQCTLLRGIVTKEITPIQCATELCTILRYTLKQATTISARKQLQEVVSKLSKLLQKFTVRNKKVPITTSDALGVKTVGACCIIQICTNLMYYGTIDTLLRVGDNTSSSNAAKVKSSSGKGGDTGNSCDSIVEAYTEAVSSSVDRLVLMLTSPVMVKDDLQWLLTGIDTTTTTTTTNNTTTSTNTTNTYTTTYANYYPSSPPPLEKAPIELFVHYLKDKYSDTSVWGSVRESLLRYDHTYQRHFVSPVKVVPVEVKRGKTKAVTLVDIVGSGIGAVGGSSSSSASGAFGGGDVAVEVASQVLPPRGRADSLKTTASNSSGATSGTGASTTGVDVPAAPTLKRQSSLIGGLLQQTRAKLRGESGSSGNVDGGSGISDEAPAVVSSVSNTTSGMSSAAIRRAISLPTNSTTTIAPTTTNTTIATTTTATTTAPARRSLVTKKAPLVGHRMSMGTNKNIVISARTLAATAAASAALLQAPPPPPQPKAVSLFQASEFAKTPNKTKSITFSQGIHGMGHATPISSQSMEEFSFSTQRDTRSQGSVGSARHTVVENTPLEALQTRRAAASTRRGYLSGGVGYMSSPSPEGASARRRARAHRTHAEGGVGSAGSHGSNGSAGSNGSGSGSGGSGGRVRHNRLSSFFATQDDAEDSDHPLEHSLEHSLAPPRRHHLGHTEVRAVGAGGDFESSQASQEHNLGGLGELGGLGTPTPYLMTGSDAFGGSRPHPLGSFLNGSTHHSLHGCEDDEEV